VTVPNSRQPNIEPGLQDQTSIALNLFNTILQTTTNRVELERSRAAIERDISIQEQREARQRVEKLILLHLSFSILILKLFFFTFTDALTVYFTALKYKLRNNTAYVLHLYIFSLNIFSLRSCCNIHCLQFN
jgi:hypothetical protein